MESAKTISQRKFSGFKRDKNVKLITNATKNLAKLTEPTTLLGSVPPTTRVEVYIGPHPPPLNGIDKGSKKT